MASIIKVDTIQDQDGNNIISEAANTITIGASGDTITIPSGATLANLGIVTGFQSTGIDDNATSTAITINSSEQVGIGTASPSNTLEIAGSGTPININSTNDEVKKIQFENSGVIQGYYGCSSGTPMRILNGSSTELMRIDSSGNVGIGTSSPATNLDINGSARVSTGSSYQFGGSDYKIEGSNVTNPRIGFITNSTERMRIDSSGNVGIGETAPLGKVHIKQNDSGVTSAPTFADALFIEDSSNTGITICTPTNGVGTIAFGDSGDNDIGKFQYQHSDNSMLFVANAAERMRIDSSGNVGIGTTSAQGKLHIMKNDASALIDGNADTLFLENTTSTGLTIGSSTTGEGAIQFSDSDDADAGKIQYAHSSNLMTFRTNGANRMFIDSSGNVGINTSSPSAKLHVDAATTASVFAPAMIITSSTGGAGGATPIDLRHSTNSSSGFRIQIAGSAGSNNAILNLIENSAMIFATNNAERMRIDNVGRILINTTSHIGNSPYLNIANTYTNSGMAIKSNTAVAHHAIEFHNTNGQVGFINTSGTSTVYSTSSDYRLKENVVEMTNATDRLKQLQPKRFNFIADEDTTVDGFLAHEVSNIVPEAISGEKDATETKEKVVVRF
jgi:hypothetical protein